MSNIDDIKNWRKEALPLVANWNCGGFNADWQISTAKTRRLLPSFKMKLLTSITDATPLNNLTPENKEFFKNSGLPLCLRTDNIADTLTNLPRLEKKEENIPISPVVWSLKNGILNDEGIADSFGPMDIWEKVGSDWSKTKFIQSTQIEYPNIAYLVI